MRRSARVLEASPSPHSRGVRLTGSPAVELVRGVRVGVSPSPSEPWTVQCCALPPPLALATDRRWHTQLRSQPLAAELDVFGPGW